MNIASTEICLENKNSKKIGWRPFEDITLWVCSISHRAFLLSAKRTPLTDNPAVRVRATPCCARKNGQYFLIGNIQSIEAFRTACRTAGDPNQKSKCRFRIGWGRKIGIVGCMVSSLISPETGLFQEKAPWRPPPYENFQPNIIIKTGLSFFCLYAKSA